MQTNESRPRLILTSVGTSALPFKGHEEFHTKHLKRSTPSGTRTLKAAEIDLSKPPYADVLQDRLRVLGEMYAQAHDPGISVEEREQRIIDFRRSSSAEISSLYALRLDPDSDRVVLIASDTAWGWFCAHLVQRFLQEQHICEDIVVDLAEGLQGEDPHLFKEQGIKNYVNKLAYYVGNYRRDYDIIMNATGGFKAVVPYTTLIGMLFELQIVYLFEEFRGLNLMYFPAARIEWGKDLFSGLQIKFDQLLKGPMAADRFWAGISNQERARIEPFVTEQNDTVRFSEFGELVYLFTAGSRGPDSRP